MKRLAILSLTALLTLGLMSCSSNERKKKKHALDDELEMIEKAKENVEKLEKKAKKQMKEIEKALDD